MKRIHAMGSYGRAGRGMRLALLFLLPMAVWAQAEKGALPRFVDNRDGTISDALTGLMWEQAPSSEKMYWPYSQEYVDALTLAGHDDWRLPSMAELNSLVREEHSDYASWLNSQGFRNVHPSDYWTATLLQYMGYEEVDHTYGYVVSMADGGFNTWLIWGEINYVWAVRGPPWSDEP